MGVEETETWREYREDPERMDFKRQQQANRRQRKRQRRHDNQPPSPDPTPSSAPFVGRTIRLPAVNMFVNPRYEEEQEAISTLVTRYEGLVSGHERRLAETYRLLAMVYFANHEPGSYEVAGKTMRWESGAQYSRRAIGKFLADMEDEMDGNASRRISGMEQELKNQGFGTVQKPGDRSTG